MATTAVAKGKVSLWPLSFPSLLHHPLQIEQALREGKEIPEGWCQDADGKPITDPQEALSCGSLLPLGGLEEGTKGTGLAMMVEIFCGILGGSTSSKKSKNHECFMIFV